MQKEKKEQKCKSMSVLKINFECELGSLSYQINGTCMKYVRLSYMIPIQMLRRGKGSEYTFKSLLPESCKITNFC